MHCGLIDYVQYGPVPMHAFARKMPGFIYMVVHDVNLNVQGLLLSEHSLCH